MSTGPGQGGTSKRGALLGQVLVDRYEIEDCLGRGSAGEVYRALDRTTGQNVAVKTLLHEGPDAIEWVRRFRREARVLAQLDHPNNVKMVDFGHTAEGMVYLVMEYLDGDDLFHVLRRRGRMSLQGAVEIAVQALGGLHDAHSKGIVHRDLKPSNIYLLRPDSPRPEAKVIDYGLAKPDVAVTVESLTREGALVGTPQYMAPEQCLGQPLTPAADLYAIGVIFYEMLVGRPPFESKNPMDLLTSHLYMKVPNLAELRSDLADPDAVHDVVSKLMAKKAEDRPPTALASIMLLEGLLSREGDAAMQHESTALGIPAMIDDDTPPDGEDVPFEALEELDDEVLPPLPGDDLAELGAALVASKGLPPNVPTAPQRHAPTPPPSIVPWLAEAPPASPPPASPPPASPPQAPSPRRSSTPQPMARPVDAPPRRPTPSGVHGPASQAGRRMPRGRVAVAAVTTRLRVEVELADGIQPVDAADATLEVRASLVPGPGRPALPLSLQRRGVRFRGAAELARPTSEGIELRLHITAPAGLVWSARVTSEKPRPHAVGADSGETSGAATRAKLILGG
ncbi:MAG: serine/threonine protein kinase [Deltaproteobacteria bacterium]|nr:serine/threonine protein kinase [Deltaproteobacteria bacterium]